MALKGQNQDVVVCVGTRPVRVKPASSTDRPETRRPPGCLIPLENPIGADRPG